MEAPGGEFDARSLDAAVAMLRRGEREMSLHTLRRMAGGGMYDQLGGGFHRYSVDARWVVPHFEKMLYDNAGLLRNYVWAHALTGDGFSRQIAEGIIGYADTHLSDRRRGGFYASQDAD